MPDTWRTPVKRMPIALASIVLLASDVPVPARAVERQPLAYLHGTDFIGGASSDFGTSYYGQERVNFVYAQPTGSHATMRAEFTLTRVPDGEVSLHVKGRGQPPEGKAGQCRSHIRLRSCMSVMRRICWRGSAVRFPMSLRQRRGRSSMTSAG